MLTLEKSLRAWGTDGFEQALKLELAEHAAELPLQQALARSSSVSDAPLEVLVHSAVDAGSVIRVRVGIFYEGLVGGCACANDPTPESPYTEYCELMLEIGKASAAVTLALLQE